MGSETSKHKLVTLDQVANVPPTLRQQTLIKGFVACLIFHLIKTPNWMKETNSWMKEN